MATFVYPKWWIKSKTVIFNALTFLLLVLPFVSDFLTDLAGIPELEPHSRLILGAVSIINVILRFGTKLPVAATRTAPPKAVQGVKTTNSNTL